MVRFTQRGRQFVRPNFAKLIFFVFSDNGEALYSNDPPSAEKCASFLCVRLRRGSGDPILVHLTPTNCVHPTSRFIHTDTDVNTGTDTDTGTGTHTHTHTDIQTQTQSQTHIQTQTQTQT